MNFQCKKGMPMKTVTTSTSMKVSTLSTNIISQITPPTLKFTTTTPSYVALSSMIITSKGTNGSISSILSTESAPLQKDSTHRTKNRNAKIKLNFTIDIQDFQDKNINISPKDVSFEIVNGNMDAKIEPKKFKNENKGIHGQQSLLYIIGTNLRTFC